MIQRNLINFLILKTKRQKKSERYIRCLQNTDAGHFYLFLKANEQLVVMCGN
jgi:hypothetical protein